MFNCHCGHVAKVAVRDLLLKYGGDTTVEAVVKAARCSLCRSKNISSTQIICVGNSDLATHSSHTPEDNKAPKDNKDFLKKVPGCPHGPTQELLTYQSYSRRNFLTVA